MTRRIMQLLAALLAFASLRASAEPTNLVPEAGIDHRGQKDVMLTFADLRPVDHGFQYVGLRTGAIWQNEDHYGGVLDLSYAAWLLFTARGHLGLRWDSELGTGIQPAVDVGFGPVILMLRTPIFPKAKQVQPELGIGVYWPIFHEGQWN